MIERFDENQEKENERKINHNKTNDKNALSKEFQLLIRFYKRG